MRTGMDFYPSKSIIKKELLDVIENRIKINEKGSGRREAALEGLPMEIIPPAVMKMDEVLERVGGDKGLLTELAGMFLEKAPFYLAGVDRAIEAGDPEALSESAHALKGAASSFSAPQVVETAQALENMGRRKDLAKARSTRDDLETKLEALSEALGKLTL
ncbi:MAG: Hpt domain-containing protein [Pseudomonadota bacterium]